VEWLRQVVVAATREGSHPVDRIGLGAPEDDDRYVAVPRPPRLTLAEAPADVEIVEEDEVGTSPLGQLERRVALLDANHFEAVIGQMTLEERGNARLRVGDKEGG
jgi:hypothetical protein